MKIELLRRYYWVDPLFGHRSPCGIDTETEYTGRWKIVKENESIKLYLECFEFVRKEIKTPLLWIKKDNYERRGFMWREKVKLPDTYHVIGERTMEILSVKNLGWISEDDLDIKVTKEFINECGNSNG